MDIFRLLNCLVGFREGVLKFQMNNVFCIFWLKTGKEGQRFPGCMALLCRSGGSPLLQVLRLKEGKNHIKYFSLRALEFKKNPTEKFNFRYEGAHFWKSEVLNCSELKCYNGRQMGNCNVSMQKLESLKLHRFSLPQ